MAYQAEWKKCAYLLWEQEWFRNYYSPANIIPFTNDMGFRELSLNDNFIIYNFVNDAGWDSMKAMLILEVSEDGSEYHIQTMALNTIDLGNGAIRETHEDTEKSAWADNSVRYEQKACSITPEEQEHIYSKLDQKFRSTATSFWIHESKLLIALFFGEKYGDGTGKSNIKKLKPPAVYSQVLIHMPHCINYVKLQIGD